MTLTPFLVRLGKRDPEQSEMTMADNVGTENREELKILEFFHIILPSITPNSQYQFNRTF